MAQRTITRLYDSYEDAKTIVHDLEASGIPHSDISLVANADAHGRSSALASPSSVTGNDHSLDPADRDDTGVRTTAFNLEDRRVGCRFLINLAGVLRNQPTHHLEVAELLDGNILQHVADRGIFDVEGLHPVLKGCRQFAGSPAELLQEELAERGVGFPDLYRMNKLFSMEEHGPSAVVGYWGWDGMSLCYTRPFGMPLDAAVVPVFGNEAEEAADPSLLEVSSKPFQSAP